jgi:hypothetical protein
MNGRLVEDLYGRMGQLELLNSMLRNACPAHEQELEVAETGNVFEPGVTHVGAFEVQASECG